MAYLSNREQTKSKQEAAAHQTHEGKVFERLTKQAEYQQNIHKHRVEANQEKETVDRKTGRELYKPTINSNYALKDRPASSAQATTNLYERHQLILQKKQKARNEQEKKYSQMRQQNTKANQFSEKIVKASR